MTKPARWVFFAAFILSSPLGLPAQSLYLAPYGGSGTADDPFQPQGVSGEWASIDLRPQCDCALVWLKADKADPALTKLGALPLDPFDAAAAARALGFAPKANSLAGLVKELVYPSLKPNAEGYKEIVVGGQSWLAEKVAGAVAKPMDPEDYFDRANGGLGTNWTTCFALAAPAIVSNQVNPSAVGGADGGAYWSNSVFADDQWSQINVVTLNTANTRNAYAVVRASTSANTLYEARVRGPFGATSAYQINKMVAAAATTLASGTVSLGSGDTIYASASGTTISFKLNGTLVNSATDAAITSGYAGFKVVANAGATTDTAVDHWVAGNLTGCAPSLALLGAGAC